MFRFTGGVVSTEGEKRRGDEDGFLVSLKSIKYVSSGFTGFLFAFSVQEASGAGNTS